MLGFKKVKIFVHSYLSQLFNVLHLEGNLMNPMSVGNFHGTRLPNGEYVHHIKLLSLTLVLSPLNQAIFEKGTSIISLKFLLRKT